MLHLRSGLGARLLSSEELHRLEDECGDFRIADLDCETEIEDGSVEYRSIDGTCNNRRRPYYGAANIAFRRSCLHKVLLTKS